MTGRDRLLAADHRVALLAGWTGRKLGFRGVALLAFSAVIVPVTS
jgi:hypothetical protein